MAASGPRPSETEANESKEAHEARYRSLGAGSGTWLDKFARNVGLPDSMQKVVDASSLKRIVMSQPPGEAEQAAQRAKMKKWGYTVAGIMIVGSVGFVLGTYLRATAPKRTVTLSAQEALRAMELRSKGVMEPTAAQIKGKEEELAALESRWQELRTRHYERHPFLYRDD